MYIRYSSFIPQSPRQPSPRHLTEVKHGAESSLLGTGDGQLPVALNLDPALGVGAVEARQRRLPGIGRLVALGLVDVVGDYIVC
jgi:hypothetical protein